jgi:predicted metal-binding protein
MWPEGSALPHTCANCRTQRSALAVIMRAMTLEQTSPAIHFSSAMRLPRITCAMLSVVAPIYGSAVRLP